MKDAFSCDYFSLKKLTVRGGYTFLVSRGKNSSADWQLLFIAEGNGEIHTTESNGNKSEPIAFEKEQIFALAPGEKVTVEGKCEIIRIICPQQA